MIETSTPIKLEPTASTDKKIQPYFSSHSKDFILYKDDCFSVMETLPKNSIDMIFADPPYMLSNNGITCQSGKMVSVNKGEWDKSKGFFSDLKFHDTWIQKCKRILKPEGTIWLSGTLHSIYMCGYLLQEHEFHILNDIAWFKPNAAPNLSCTVFAHSHETLLWARKQKKSKNVFNYAAMKKGVFPEDPIKKSGKQMRSVWSIPTPAKREKQFGKHPTQKPISLLQRIILASTNDGHTVLDPFNGSGTTGIACALIGNRKYLGIEIDKKYVDLTINRYKEIGDQGTLFKDICYQA